MQAHARARARGTVGVLGTDDSLSCPVYYKSVALYHEMRDDSQVQKLLFEAHTSAAHNYKGISYKKGVKEARGQSAF